MSSAERMLDEFAAFGWIEHGTGEHRLFTTLERNGRFVIAEADAEQNLGPVVRLRFMERVGVEGMDAETYEEFALIAKPDVALDVLIAAVGAWLEPARAYFPTFEPTAPEGGGGHHEGGLL